MEDKNIFTCPVCRGNNNYVLNLPYKTLRHLDFAEFTLTSGNVICECSGCGAVFRSFRSIGEEVSDDMLSIENLYKSENYANHQEEHMVREDNGVLSPLSEVQAKIITEALPSKLNLKGILDIGCFDGKLLASLSKRINAEHFLGFDVDKRVGFPFELGIDFTQKPIDEITGTFDLILLSQSIIYIPDLENLFNNISRLLSENGVIFIHVPNLSVRPCSVLLGDQHHYFSKKSIRSMLEHFNFECSFFLNTPFPRDILLFAKLNRAQNDKPDILNPGEKILDGIKNYLDVMVRNIQRVSIDSSKLSILGTTMEAGFVHTIIPDNILYFVDENPKKVGMTFLGKPVRHPKSLTENDVVIIPMGETGEAIRKRFSNQYPGVYVCA